MNNVIASVAVYSKMKEENKEKLKNLRGEIAL